MKFLSRPFVALGLSAVLAGCGGANPAPAESAKDAVPSSPSVAPSSGASIAAEPTLEKAEAPKGVFARARLTSLTAVLDGLKRGVPAADHEAFGIGDIERELRALSEWVDVDAAVEMAAFLNPKPREVPLFFYSFGVSSRDRALRYLVERGETPSEGRGGSYYFTHEGSSCLLGRSLGRSPYRVVCAESRSALDSGADWALRGLPTEKVGESLLAAEFDPRPIVAVFGRDIRKLRSLAPVGAAALSTGESKLDSAIKKALLALADEVVFLSDDLAAVRFQVAENGGSFKALFDVDFRAKASFVADLTARSAASEGAPPPAFLTLPGNVTSAGYSRGVDPALFADLRKGVSELASGFARKQGVPSKSAEKIGTLLEKLIDSPEFQVRASGPLGPSKDGELPKAEYQFYGEAGGKKRVLEIYDALGTVVSDAKVWSELGFEKPLFSFKKETKTVKGAPGAIVYHWAATKEFREKFGEKFDAIPGALPSESKGQFLDFLFDYLEGGYLAVRENAGVTWVVSGTSLDAVSKGFLSLSDSKAPRIESHRAFQGVSKDKAVSQSFVELGLFLRYLAAFAGDEVGKKTPSARLASTAPLFFRGHASKDPLRLRLEIEVPVEAASELARFAKEAGETKRAEKH